MEKNENDQDVEVSFHEEMYDRILIMEIMTMYWYNTDPLEICQAVYKGADNSYIAAKAVVYPAGLCLFWGNLDLEHRQRFINAACEKYEKQALQRVDGMYDE